MASPHLQIPDISASQNNKEVTHNAAVALLDRKISQIVQMTVTAADTFTAAETRENSLVEMIGSAGATTVDMFDTNEVYMRVVNNTNGVITIRNSAGGGLRQPVITVLGTVKFHYDGTDFLDAGSGSGGGSSTVTAIGTLDLYHVRDEKTDGTDGGSSSASTWNVRTLNTEKVTSITGASLAANRVTLPAGTYEIEASAPAREVDTHRLRLQDITGAATLLVGQNADTDLATTPSAATPEVQTTAHLFGRFTLTVQSDLELQHWTESANATDGMGAAGTDTGSVEVYADVRIRKVSAVVTAPGIPFKGAMVKLTADETLTTTVAIPWDAEVYDVGDFFTLGSATRLTVPAGITRAQLTAGLGMNPAASISWHVEKNGARVEGGGLQTDDATATAATYITGVLEVVAGDFFELIPTFASGSPVLRSDVTGATHFSIEAVEAVAPSMLPRGALANRSSSFSLPDNATTVVPFNAEVYDTDAIHDNSVNPSRLTVPTGVSQVRLQAHCNFNSNTTGHRLIQVLKNAAVFPGMPELNFGAGGTGLQRLTTASAVVDVVGGDFFELGAFQNSGSAVNIGTTTDDLWFSMEVVEPAVVAGGAGLEAEWFDVDLLYPSTTNGAAAPATTELTAGNPNVRGSVFVNATEEHLQFQWKPPRRWDKGTVQFRPYYSHAGSQTGGLDGVAWGLAGVAVGNASNIDVAFGTEIVVTVDNAAANQVFIGALSAAITVAGTPDDDKQVYWEISRVVADAADDFDGAGGMRLHGVEIFWTSDKSTDD